MTAALPRIHDLCKPTICCHGVHYTITNESDCLYGRLQYHTHTHAAKLTGAHVNDG